MENKMNLSQNLKKLVQVISHHGILSELELQDISQTICGNDNNVNFFRYINEMNTALNEVDMAIKLSICELTGQKYWTLCSTVLNESDGEDEEDEPARGKNASYNQQSQNPQTNDDEENDLMLSSFTKPQTELFRLICDDIILLPVHCISSNDCINLVGSMKSKMIRSEAERFLKQAIKGLWLTMIDGQVYIGPRSIAELMPFFKTTYEVGLTSCPICNQITFYGHTCQQCDSRIHYYCLANFKKFKCKLKCTKCGGQLDVDQDYLASFSSSQAESNNIDQRSQPESNNSSQTSQPQRASRRAKRGGH